jgi:hypothetical protein
MPHSSRTPTFEVGSRLHDLRQVPRKKRDADTGEKIKNEKKFRDHKNGQFTATF